MRSADAGRLHLLEVGVQWPPEAFLRRKLTGLAEAGIRVTVAADVVRDPTFVLPGVELLRTPCGLSVRAIRAGLAMAVRSPRRFVRLVRGVWRVPPELRRRHGGRAGLLAVCLPLARLRPDVVQFEWNIAAVDHLPLFEVWDCPVLTSCRGSDLTVYPHIPGLGSYADRLPEVMARARAVHCVSESLCQTAVAFGMDPGKAQVITPAVDSDVFHPVARPRRATGCFTILTVGDGRWEKGYEYALAAVRELLDGGVPVRYEMVGVAPAPGAAPSPEQQRIQHTVADLGLGDHVVLVPRATAKELSARLAQADVLLHASLAEGIPNVVLEAMACGVPVVSTDCGSVSEALSDGTEGYIVPARAPDRLAGALNRLWRDPELRERMGQAGRRTIESRFTLSGQIEQFLDLYRAVTG